MPEGDKEQYIFHLLSGGGALFNTPLVKIEFVLDFIEDQGFRRSVFFFSREECNGSRL